MCCGAQAHKEGTQSPSPGSSCLPLCSITLYPLSLCPSPGSCFKWRSVLKCFWLKLQSFIQKGALKTQVAQGVLIPESIQLFEVKFSDLPVVVAFSASFLWVFYPPAPRATSVYKHNWIKMSVLLHSCSLRAEWG